MHLSNTLLYFLSLCGLGYIGYVFRDSPFTYLFFLSLAVFFILLTAYRILDNMLFDREAKKAKIAQEWIQAKTVYPNSQGLPPIPLDHLLQGGYIQDILATARSNMQYLNPPHILHKHEAPPVVQTQASSNTESLASTVLDTSKPPTVVQTILDSDAAIIFGARGSGKTNLLKHVAKAMQGEVRIADVHTFPNKWLGVTRVVGGGRDFMAIDNLIQEALAIMHRRAELLATGEATEEQFLGEPVVIIIDEILTVVQHLPDTFAENLRFLIAESRKFGIILIVATQGAGVQALGLERHKDLKKSLLMVRLYKDSLGNRTATVALGEEEPREAVLPPVFIDTPIRARVQPVTIPLEKYEQSRKVVTLSESPQGDYFDKITTTTAMSASERDLSLPTKSGSRYYRTLTEAIKTEMQKDTGSYTAGKYTEYKEIVLERQKAGEISIEKLRK